jgi:hypothetical protein
LAELFQQVRPGGEPRAVGAKDDKMLRLQLEVLLPLLMMLRSLELTMHRLLKMRTGKCLETTQMKTATVQEATKQSPRSLQRRRKTARAILTTEPFRNKQSILFRENIAAVFDDFTSW